MSSKEVSMERGKNVYNWRDVPKVVFVVMVARMKGELDPLETLGLTDDEVAQLEDAIEDGWFDE
tara:strand:- start:107 stop:298 length:192 start_codon:yes stop_codon:yes gene_type:complete